MQGEERICYLKRTVPWPCERCPLWLTFTVRCRCDRAAPPLNTDLENFGSLGKTALAQYEINYTIRATLLEINYTSRAMQYK